MRTAGTIIAALALVAGTASCSSDASTSDNTDITYQSLVDGAGGSDEEPCPIKLDAALKAAGVPATRTASGSAEIAPAMPANTVVDPQSSTPIDVPARAAGVLVTCHIDLADDASVDVDLFASEDGGAAFTLAPTISKDADLPAAEMSDLLDELSKSDIGEPVTLPDDSAAASVAMTQVDGAKSAVLLVTGTDTVDTSTLDKIAVALDDSLH